MSETEQSFVFPVSFAQQRLWFLHQLAPDTPSYNCGGALRLHAAIDADLLRRSVNEIIRRHEVLRTTFQMVEGRPMQVVSDALELALPVIDLGTSPLPQAQIESLVAEEVRRPFNLAKGPLLRVTLMVSNAADAAFADSIIVLAMHHIISDAWSMQVFAREMTTLYRAFARGEDPPLAELPIQYADYAAWQRRWLEGIEERQLAYWRQQLAELPTLELEKDYPRPLVPSYRGARYGFDVGDDPARRLYAICVEEGATVFMGLLAVFATLLHRHTGQDEVAIGAPVAGRNRPELINLIGFFVNLLVLRLDFSGDPHFRTILRRVRQTALDAFDHQDVPFERVVEDIKPVRDTARHPLCQVTFQMLHSAPDDAGSAVATIDVNLGTAAFDLSLDIWETGGSLRGRIEYSTDLFDHATIHRFVTHFRTLLDRLCDRPERPLSEIHLLDERELHRVLYEWNHADITVPAGLPVEELVACQAARTPAAAALVEGAKTYTYRELNTQADRLASRLAAVDGSPEVPEAPWRPVGLYVGRSREMVVAMLAVLRAGRAYVPLDASAPPARLRHILDDSGAALVLTTQRQADAAMEALGGGRPMEFIDEATPMPPAGRHPDAPGYPSYPGNSGHSRQYGHGEYAEYGERLAYIIYTSGSTGKPKGCLIAAKSLAQHVAAAMRYFGLGPNDRVLQFTAGNFDVAAEEIFPTLGSGATLCIPPRETLNSMRDFSDYLERNRITVVNLPAPFWHNWVSYLDTSARRPWGSLRLVIAGSDTLAVDQVERWQALAPASARLCNAYGVTEATITATLYPVPAQWEAPPPRSVPIGWPFGNTKIYLLDRYRQPVPVGVPGELYIGGEGLARGYAGRPDLTAERFIFHAFNNDGGDGPVRLYRTGDRCRYLVDGALEYLGRNDRQVSIRGHRIELGEVEHALAEHPAIAQAAVELRAGPSGGPQLVAWIAGPVSAAEARTFLQRLLPAYMVPASFMILDALPLTASGKIDRQALRPPTRPEGPEDAEASGNTAGKFAAPSTAEEQALATIWSQVLGVERISVHENFFELGGDSILSIQITARANQAGLRLTPLQIFQHQTIAELASEACLAAAPVSTAVEPDSYDADDADHAENMDDGQPIPLTPIQRWFFEQELCHPHHYNQAVMLPIEGTVDIRAIEAAITALVARHQALRLRFRRDDSSWKQEYVERDETVPLSFSVENLLELPESVQRTRVAARATELQESFDLSNGPLIRTTLFNLSPGSSQLLIVIHHLAVDGVSWRILLEELTAAYRQAKAGVSIDLPARTTEFAHWARRLEKAGETGRFQATLDYYRSLPRHRLGRLPIDYHQGPNTVASADRIIVALAPQKTEALLRDVPKAFGTQINDALLTAVSLALAGWSGRAAQWIEVEGHGREPLFSDLDLSRTVGWFTSMWPVLLEPCQLREPDQPLTQLSTAELAQALSRVREQLSKVPDNGIGYGLLRYGSRAPEASRFLAALPAAEVSFNYMGQFTAGVGSGSWHRGPSRDLSQARSHLIEIDGHIAAGCLEMAWTYSRHYHQRATIERVAGDFREYLERIATAAADRRLTPKDFPLANLSQKGLDAIVRRMSRTAGNS
ncbi:MAG TPA: amino acid adenylation domain-containing protein [Nitrosospira sp.]|nr:amino acid adenylation domain-containing protein [Nitrosospira sp.]